MAALAEATTTIRLGQMVGCALYRPPALLAKITSNVDVISGGRLEWGIGAGWYGAEFAAYGSDFPPPKDRIPMMRETVESVKAMWTESLARYDGKYVRFSARPCDPNPSHKP